MDALSLRGFLLIAALAGLVSAAAIGACCLAGGLGPGEAAAFAAAGLPVGLMFGGCCYLVQLAREMRALHLRAEDLLPGEVVERETPHSVVHYRTGRPGRFWETVGGKLVLTSRRLVFLAHRGQPWQY